MMDDNSRPYLVASTTQDDESAVSQIKDEPLVNRRAIAYLLRYETMVRQQEAEHLATLAHLRPLLESLSEDRLMSTNIDPDADLAKQITFQQLQDALEAIENSPHSYMKTDLQLMMVLKTMVAKNTEEEHGSITWAEFLQCYKTIIAGMQTLQHIHEPRNRARVKDRTLSMISLFEPPATKLLDSLPREIHFPVIKEEEENFERTLSLTRNKLRLSKKLLYLVLGVVLGVALVVGTGSFWEQQETIAPNSKTIFVPDQLEQPVCDEISPIGSAPQPPVIDASNHSNEFPLPLPPEVDTNLVGTNLVSHETIPNDFPMETKNSPKIKTRLIVSGALGGVAGFLAAPILWKAVQTIPAVLSAIPGWGIAAFVGSVVVQGILQSAVLWQVHRKQE